LEIPPCGRSGFDIVILCGVYGRQVDWDILFNFPNHWLLRSSYFHLLSDLFEYSWSPYLPFWGRVDAGRHCLYVFNPHPFTLNARKFCACSMNPFRIKLNISHSYNCSVTQRQWKMSSKSKYYSKLWDIDNANTLFQNCNKYFGWQAIIMVNYCCMDR
jgi:hypothetical protein